jgi:membrane protein DedA with SNARE-associated domain
MTSVPRIVFGLLAVILITANHLALWSVLSDSAEYSLSDNLSHYVSGLLIYVSRTPFGFQAFGLLPPLLFHALKLRSKFAYMLGGLAGSFGTLPIAGSSDATGRASFYLLAGMAVTGVLAGLAYWYLAGRFAGNWRQLQLKQ